jgi:serine/threonine-protein kinase SRK2
VILTTRGKTYDGKVADIWSAGVMLYVMLVGAYPFERPEDKADAQKLQKMIQRILHVDYAVPQHVKLSEECRDLLRRVLVADPTKRISLDEVYSHPWYAKNLPPGVREMNDRPQPLPEGLQTVEQVTAIVQEARRATGGAAAGAAGAAGGAAAGAGYAEGDEYIDDAMDNSWNEASLDYNA